MDEIRHLIKNLYQNTVALTLAKRECDEGKIKQAEEQEKEFILHNNDSFDMLLISGYKELVYEYIKYSDDSDGSLFTEIDYDIMKELERIIGDQKKVRDHIFDVDHPVFDDGMPHNFNFYYEWEIYGNSILDILDE